MSQTPLTDTPSSSPIKRLPPIQVGILTPHLPNNPTLLGIMVSLLQANYTAHNPYQKAKLSYASYTNIAKFLVTVLNVREMTDEDVDEDDDGLDAYDNPYIESITRVQNIASIVNTDNNNNNNNPSGLHHKILKLFQNRTEIAKYRYLDKIFSECQAINQDDNGYHIFHTLCKTTTYYPSINTSSRGTDEAQNFLLLTPLSYPNSPVILENREAGYIKDTENQFLCQVRFNTVSFDKKKGNLSSNLQDDTALATAIQDMKNTAVINYQQFIASSSVLLTFVDFSSADCLLSFEHQFLRTLYNVMAFHPKSPCVGTRLLDDQRPIDKDVSGAWSNRFFDYGPNIIIFALNCTTLDEHQQVQGSTIPTTPDEFELYINSHISSLLPNSSVSILHIQGAQNNNQTAEEKIINNSICTQILYSFQAQLLSIIDHQIKSHSGKITTPTQNAFEANQCDIM